MHEDEYATIIAYTLASEEYHEALQIHLREDSDSYGQSGDDMGEDLFAMGGGMGHLDAHKPMHFPESRKNSDIENGTMVIIGDVPTVDDEKDFTSPYRKRPDLDYNNSTPDSNSRKDENNDLCAANATSAERNSANFGKLSPG